MYYCYSAISSYTQMSAAALESWRFRSLCQCVCGCEKLLFGVKDIAYPDGHSISQAYGSTRQTDDDTSAHEVYMKAPLCEITRRGKCCCAPVTICRYCEQNHGGIKQLCLNDSCPCCRIVLRFKSVATDVMTGRSVKINNARCYPSFYYR